MEDLKETMKGESQFSMWKATQKLCKSPPTLTNPLHFQSGLLLAITESTRNLNVL